MPHEAKGQQADGKIDYDSEVLTTQAEQGDHPAGRDTSPFGTASLDSSSTSTSTGRQLKTWFRFYPVLPLVYAGHVWFRRRIPRVMPPLTSLRLWELYSFAGYYALLETEKRRMHAHWLEDRDLAIIQVGAHHLWRDRRNTVVAEALTAEYDKSFPSRAGSYPRPADGILAQFIWWNNHMWSTNQTWRGTLTILAGIAISLAKRGEPGWSLPVQLDLDWYRAITFFANAIHGVDGGRNANYAWPWAKVFAIVTPVAMFARTWVRWRRNPILWLNGLQRVTFYGMAYLWPMHLYHFYWYSETIQDKRKFARIICELCPGLDKAVDKAIEENKERLLKETYR